VYRLLLLVIALIVYGSLYPWHLDFDRSGANPLWVVLHAWPHGIDRFVLRDAAINLALYFPLGMAAFLAAARRHGRWVAFGAAPLIALGTLPSEPPAERLLSHVLVRLTVTPSWVNHRYFFVEVSQPTAPTSTN